ncbi:MAG TPA: hypothetical protein VFV11_06945 [Solimonas sp.]|nr:hypothetical protein [Solimonas sp.]
MKALTQFNAVVLAFAATFAVILGVVCLMYAVNLDAAPRLRAEWPTVSRVTLAFWLLMVVAGAVFLRQRRAPGVRWPEQGVLLASLVAGAQYILRVLA